MDQRLIDRVFDTASELAAAGTTEFTPGHIADALRAASEPVGTWQIRAALTALEDKGKLSHNRTYNRWALS